MVGFFIICGEYGQGLKKTQAMTTKQTNKTPPKETQNRNMS